MSKKQKDADPFGDYPTPEWCVDRLIDHLGWVQLSWARCLEPCAGEGRIIRRIDERLGDPYVPRWEAWELQERYTKPLTGLGLSSVKVGIDAVKMARQMGAGLAEEQAQRVRLGREPLATKRPFDFIITNPPFELAMPLLLALRPLADCVIMLLRVNFLASKERHAYWSTGGMPEAIYQLPDRPKFRAGKSDSTEYGWWRWGPERIKVTSTRVELLALTPLEERNKWEKGR